MKILYNSAFVSIIASVTLFIAIFLICDVFCTFESWFRWIWNCLPTFVETFDRQLCFSRFSFWRTGAARERGEAGIVEDTGRVLKIRLNLERHSWRRCHLILAWKKGVCRTIDRIYCKYILEVLNQKFQFIQIQSNSFDWWWPEARSGDWEHGEILPHLRPGTTQLGSDSASLQPRMVWMMRRNRLQMVIAEERQRRSKSVLTSSSWEVNGLRNLDCRNRQCAVMIPFTASERRVRSYLTFD